MKVTIACGRVDCDGFVTMSRQGRVARRRPSGSISIGTCPKCGMRQTYAWSADRGPHEPKELDDAVRHLRARIAARSSPG